MSSRPWARTPSRLPTNFAPEPLRSSFQAQRSEACFPRSLAHSIAINNKELCTSFRRACDLPCARRQDDMSGPDGSEICEHGQYNFEDETSNLAQLAQLEVCFCDFARRGASRIKRLDSARGRFQHVVPTLGIDAWQRA